MNSKTAVDTAAAQPSAELDTNEWTIDRWRLERCRVVLAYGQADPREQPSAEPVSTKCAHGISLSIYCEVCHGEKVAGGLRVPSAGKVEPTPLPSEDVREVVMAYRKACIEWGESKTSENHKTMIEWQWELMAALAAAPAGAGEPTEQSADATRLAFLNSRDGHLYDMLRSITYSSLEGYRSWIDRGMSGAGAGKQPSEAPTRQLTDEQIDRIAENCAKAMPDGISGFCKTWGWRQFARELLDICAGHERATPVTAVGGEPGALWCKECGEGTVAGVCRSKSPTSSRCFALAPIPGEPK